MAKQRLLLHACCGPCSAYVIESLRPTYDVTLFFYNPNIYPKEEYLKRLDAVKKVSKEMRVPLVIEEYDQEIWNDAVKGCESDFEGGKRCEICIHFRLEVTAEYAKKNNYDIFATSLTVSPYKNAIMINDIGKDLDREYNIEYLESDFKQNDGYKKSIILSKQLGLYRQAYCGCIYSMKTNMESPNE